MGGGDKGATGNVIIPDTGAAKYWYVDQSAPSVPTVADEPFDPMKVFDEQGHDAPPTEDMLRRLGLLPEGTQPSL